MFEDISKDNRILNLFDFLGMNYLLKNGSESVAQRHCMFHYEKSPSLFVYSDFITCYGCGVGYVLNPNLDSYIENLEVPTPSKFRNSAPSRYKTLLASGLYLEHFLVDLKLGFSIQESREIVYNSFRDFWRSGKLTCHDKKTYLEIYKNDKYDFHDVNLDLISFIDSQKPVEDIEF